eukprot:gene12178-5668_t
MNFQQKMVKQDTKVVNSSVEKLQSICEKNNKSEVKKQLEANPHLYQHLPSKMKNKKEIILICIKELPSTFEFIPKEFKTEEFYLYLLSEGVKPLFFEFMKQDLSKEFSKNVVQKNGLFLEYFEKKKIDGELINLAINQNPLSIEFVPTEMLNNDLYVSVLQKIQSRNLILESMKIKSLVKNKMTDSTFLESVVKNQIPIDLLIYALDDNVGNLLLTLFKRDLDTLETYITESTLFNASPIKSNIEKLFSKEAENLNFTSDLAEDTDFMLEIVERYDYSLEFISDKLTSNEEFVKRALLCSHLSFEFISEDLKRKKEIAMIPLEAGITRFVEDFCEELKNDRDIMEMATEENPRTIVYASPKLRSNRDFISNLPVTCLKFLNSAFLDDPEFMWEQIERDQRAACGLRKNLSFNFDFISKVVTKYPECVQYLLHLHKNSNEMERIISINPNCYSFIPNGYEKQHNTRWMKLSIAPPFGNLRNFENFPSKVKTNEFCDECTRLNSKVFDLIPNHLPIKNNRDTICFGRGYFGFNFSDTDRNRLLTGQNWFILKSFKNMNFEFEGELLNREVKKMDSECEKIITFNSTKKSLSSFNINVENTSIKEMDEKKTRFDFDVHKNFDVENSDHQGESGFNFESMNFFSKENEFKFESVSLGFNSEDIDSSNDHLTTGFVFNSLNSSSKEKNKDKNPRFDFGNLNQSNDENSCAKFDFHF